MIGRIAGVLLEKNPPHLLVDCNGVGYEIAVNCSRSAASVRAWRSPCSPA
jgi:Holliday junction resolvasome RuvABC DNA-binding subunit